MSHSQPNTLCLHEVVQERVSNPVGQQQAESITLGPVERAILVVDDANQNALDWEDWLTKPTTEIHGLIFLRFATWVIFKMKNLILNSQGPVLIKHPYPLTLWTVAKEP